MNAQRDETAAQAAIAPDPLTSLRASTTAIAELAFGCSLETLAPADAGGRHLALLTTDTLQLDLGDPAQRQFGDYELLEQIGEGGMGVVYRAHQRSLDRDVALKLLAAGPWASREFIERFRREAQHAASMQHPNIVAIHEVGSIEELHFFSMRLVRGGSLATLLKSDGTLAPLRAAQMLRTIAEAVDYAHRLGVLHLDLKPANVLLDENGSPHVADFGLARRLDSALADGEDEISGTPSYMAPEQALPRTARISPATDIWGLGAILYELVTGQPPFLGNSPHDTLRLVVEGSLVSPRRIVPNLSRDLQAIILKCLGHETGERYETARALADDLGRFIEGRAVRARPLSAPQRVLRWARREPRLAVTTAAGVAALAIGLAATTQQWRRADSNAHLAAQSATLANERLWQARIDQAAVAVSSGHGYEALPGLAANIKEREAQGLQAREDRIRIANVERSVPRLIDVIALGSSILGVALSPDGKSVAVATADETLRLFDAATGKQLWQTGFKGATHFFVGNGDAIRLVLLRFSPDGRYLIGRNHPGLPTAVTPIGFDEVLFDAVSGKLMLPPAEIMPGFSDATYSPDGTYAVVRNSEHRAMLMRTADWSALGKPYAFGVPEPAWLITARARHVLTLNAGFVVLSIHDSATLAVRHVLDYPANRRVTAWVSSPDGGSVLLGHLDGQIELLDCATGRSEIISPSPVGRVGWLVFSPDAAWFGAVADSGEVLVWDSATRQLAAPLMHLNATPEYHRDQIFIDAAARTVLASADNEMGLWYLPDAVTAPLRVTGEFPHANAWWLRAFGYDAKHGMIATDAGQGELRLWRMQQLAPRGRSPPLPPDPLRADSGRIVAVDGNVVRLVNAIDNQPVGAPLELPQAPGFAELTADEASLVVAAGRELFVYDASKWILRRSPIVLPNDPARIFLHPDSRHALVLFADYYDGVNRQLGQLWDLVDGTPSTGTVPHKPLTDFRFAADGRSLLSWTHDMEDPDSGNLQLSDAATLEPRWAKPVIVAKLVGGKPGSADLTDAQLSTDGTRIDALTSEGEGDIRTASRLWQLDAASGAAMGHTLIRQGGGGESFALMADRRHAIIQRPDYGPMWWDAAQGATVLPAASGNEYDALILAADGSMFARAGGMDRVNLASTSDRNWLAPALPTGVPTADQHAEFPTHLAFTRDNKGLVGRTRGGEWLYWNIEPDTRPADQIVSEAALLNPAQVEVKDGLSQPLSDAQRGALRAADAGPPVHLGGFPEQPVPPRPANLPANLFDLGAFYDRPLQWMSRIRYSTFRELAPGVHRFLGVDYDVRGVIQTSMKGFAAEADPGHPPPPAVRGVRPGVGRFAALDVLVAQHTTMEHAEEKPFASIELDYRDGGRERMPIIYRRDAADVWAGEEGKQGEASPRVAWRATEARTPWSVMHFSRVYSVRLVNPHPEREVASLALESVDEPWSTPLFFAITAETSDAAPSPIGSPSTRAPTIKQ